MALLTQTPIAPKHIEQVAGEIEKAETLVDRGYGLVVPFTHFSAGETHVSVASLILASPKFSKKPFICPVAYHQYRARAELGMIARLAGITLIPIVTGDTVRKKLNLDERGNALSLGYGNSKYLRVARKGLNEGAIVFISPQLGQRPYLEFTQEEPIKFLLGREEDSNLRQVALLFMGLSIQGISDYSTVRNKMNFGRTYEVRLGPTITKDEIYSLSREMKTSVDAMVFIVLSTLVDTNYNGIDPKLTFEFLSRYV